MTRRTLTLIAALAAVPVAAYATDAAVSAATGRDPILVVITAGVSSLLSGGMSAALVIAKLSREFGQITEQIRALQHSVESHAVTIREHDLQLARLQGALERATLNAQKT